MIETAFADCLPEYDEKSRDVFGANYPRLQKLKAKYDPGNTFNKLFAVQPSAGMRTRVDGRAR